MHNKIINKVIAGLMCILLLSNFGLSVTLAADSFWDGFVEPDNEAEQNPIEDSSSNNNEGTQEGNQGTTSDDGDRAGYIVFKNDSNGNAPTTEIRSNKVVAQYGNVPMSNGAQRIRITPTETAIYTVSVSNGDSELEYFLRDGQGNCTRLAARYKNSRDYTILSSGSSSSTTIDVILEAGKEYEFSLDSQTSGNVQISMEKRNIQRLAMAGTNIPSSVVSANDEYNSSESLESYNDSSIRLVEYSSDQINDFIVYGNPDDSEANGGALEGILVDLTLSIGTMFTFVAENFIDANVKLSMDNIIFNKLDQVVIDLGSVGNTSFTGSRGVFAQSGIGEIISKLFNGLKGLAITIYVIMLLYIGLKILLSVGTKDQSKYFKFIEYWLSGVVILAILPPLFPLVPTINNSIVAMLESKAKALNGNYSTEEVLQRLGYDTTYLGEDAEVVELQNLIDIRIRELNAQMTGTATSREEAQQVIDSRIADALERFHGEGLSEEQLARLNGKINGVIGLINENFDSWSPEIQREYEAKLDAIREEIYSSVSTIGLVNRVFNYIPVEVRQSQEAYNKVTEIMSWVQSNATNWNRVTIEVYNKKLTELSVILANNGLDRLITSTRNGIDDARRSYISYATQSDAFRNLENMFSDYRNAVIQEEIDVLQDMRNGVANDIMTILKQEAQQRNRFVYAVAWIILVFQMFSILFLYYKRIIVILVLIIIFPLVMAFYVIDKIGDGESQSLNTWLKEYISNCVIQILHAAIYIILINTGIEACNSDPRKNWFFLVLTVCFLFPGEGIMRRLLGLNASTLGALKTNVGMLVAGGVAVKKMTRNGYRAIKAYKQNGGISGAIEKAEKKRKAEKEKVKQQEEEKKKKKQKLHDSREKLRQYRQERIDNGTASKTDKVLGKVTDAKEKAKIKISGFMSHGVGKGFAMVGKGVATVGKGTYKLARTTAKYGNKALKTGFNIAKKAAGITAGIVEGAESFGKEGAVSGFVTARTVAKDIGGFKDRPKVMSNKDSSMQPKFATRYHNGQRVSGTNKVTPGNIKTSTPSVSSNTATRIRMHFNTANPPTGNNSNNS